MIECCFFVIIIGLFAGLQIVFYHPKKKSKKIDAVDPKQKTRKGKDSLMKYKQKKV